MLPGWQRWMSQDRRCFWKPHVTRLAAMGESRSQMLLEIACYQVGSDECSPNWMPLGTRRKPKSAEKCTQVSGRERAALQLLHTIAAHRACLTLLCGLLVPSPARAQHLKNAPKPRICSDLASQQVPGLLARIPPPPQRGLGIGAHTRALTWLPCVLNIFKQRVPI